VIRGPWFVVRGGDRTLDDARSTDHGPRIQRTSAIWGVGESRLAKWAAIDKGGWVVKNLGSCG
jgi:hypothetical protein